MPAASRFVQSACLVLVILRVLSHAGPSCRAGAKHRGGTGRHPDCLPRFLGCICLLFKTSVTVSSSVPGGRVAEMAMAMTLAEGLLKRGMDVGSVFLP